MFDWLARTADLSEAELRALYPQSRLPAYSEHTPRSVAELSRQLQQDRLRGRGRGRDDEREQYRDRQKAVGHPLPSRWMPSARNFLRMMPP